MDAFCSVILEGHADDAEFAVVLPDGGRLYLCDEHAKAVAQGDVQINPIQEGA